jgi:MATE family multidrug resistance protein
MASSFEEVITSPHKDALLKFIRSSPYARHLDFYEAVLEFRTLDQISDRCSFAQRLYSTFIADESEKEISIEHNTRKEIQNNLASAPTDLFDQASAEVLNGLSLSVLPRFFQSTELSGTPKVDLPADVDNGVELDVEIHFESEEPDRPLPINGQNWIRKTKQLAPVALSVCLSNLIYVMNGLVLLMFVGRLGGVASASAGLGNFFIAVTGLSVCHGVLGAEDTLCSQAFGAKNMHRVSIVFQRSILITLVIFIPIGILWLFTESVLLALGQDKEVSKLAGTFVLIYLPSLPLFIVNECLKRYLCSQGIAYPELIATLCSNIISVTFGYFLILRTSVGFYGMPIALGVSNVLTFTILSGWTILKRLHVPTWRRISASELFDRREIVEFMKLGGPAALMMCAQWVGVELHGIMAGWLGVTSLAAQAIIMNSNAAVFSIAIGGMVSVCVSVGNQMGAGRFREAMLAYLIGLFDFEILAIVIATALFLLRNAWGTLFTNVSEVHQLVAKVAPIWAIFIVSDAASGVGGGAIRGVGEQVKGAICNLFCFYVIGIPLGYWMAFPVGLNWGLSGLWVGITVASYSVSFLINGILIFGNWDQWATRARKRSVDHINTNDSIEAGIITTGPSRNSIELCDLTLTHNENASDPDR